MAPILVFSSNNYSIMALFFFHFPFQTALLYKYDKYGHLFSLRILRDAINKYAIKQPLLRYLPTTTAKITSVKSKTRMVEKNQHLYYLLQLVAENVVYPNDFV